MLKVIFKNKITLLDLTSAKPGVISKMYICSIKNLLTKNVALEML